MTSYEIITGICFSRGVPAILPYFINQSFFSGCHLLLAAFRGLDKQRTCNAYRAHLMKFRGGHFLPDPLDKSILFYSVNPISRLSVQMRECKNNYCVILNGVENLVRKFVNDVPPNFLALGRPCLRVLLYAEE
jgi:hypothetical protein